MVLPAEASRSTALEADELLMSVARLAASHDLSRQHIEGGEEGGRAVAHAVAGHGPSGALLYGKIRLGAIQRLDLGLLIDAEHYGVGRWTGYKGRPGRGPWQRLQVVGQLEGMDALRSQAMGLLDTLHQDQPHAGPVGHQPSGPVYGLAGRVAQHQGHAPVVHILRQSRPARRPDLVAQ